MKVKTTKLNSREWLQLLVKHKGYILCEKEGKYVVKSENGGTFPIIYPTQDKACVIEFDDQIFKDWFECSFIHQDEENPMVYRLTQDAINRAS